MAKISTTNGTSVQRVADISAREVDAAVEIAEIRGGHAYEEVNRQTYATERDWLEAYCNAHERHHGKVFVAW